MAESLTPFSPFDKAVKDERSESDQKLHALILGRLDDLFGSFFYYDRKEDEELERGAIEQAVADGIITEQEMIDKAAEMIRDNVPEPS